MSTVKAVLAILSFIVLVWIGAYVFDNVVYWAQMPVLMSCFMLTIIIIILFVNYNKGEK